jgi:aerotaxis receptor
MEKVTPIDKEYVYKGNVIISQTDTNGFITYANRAFAQASNYKIDELLGNPQNIIRHPDMPKAIFAKMWGTISGGQAWNGLIKNLRKDGMFYWVETEIIPIFAKDDIEITGYIAVRKEASRKNIKEAEVTYKKMLDTEK